VTERPIVSEATTPDRIRVVIFADTWHDHILDPQVGHAEMAPHIDATLGYRSRGSMAAASAGRSLSGRAAQSRSRARRASGRTYRATCVRAGAPARDDMPRRRPSR